MLTTSIYLHYHLVFSYYSLFSPRAAPELAKEAAEAEAAAELAAAEAELAGLGAGEHDYNAPENQPGQAALTPTEIDLLSA